jgi:hypothetical protein
MRSEAIKNRAVGLLRSPRRAPVVGVGADFKTTASWGGLKRPLGPNASAVGLHGGVVARRYRRFVAYRVTGFDGVVRVVAELLFKISRVGRGSVVYVNAGKLVRYLGLGGPIHPIDLSVIYSLMEKLGFEVVEASRGKAVIVRTDHPLIEKIKAAKNVDEVVEIIKRYLGE